MSKLSFVDSKIGSMVHQELYHENLRCLEPNNTIFASHPYDPSFDSIKPEFIVASESDKIGDRVCVEGLRQELQLHNLMPDGKTFYLIDFGLPHLPSLQSVLLDYGVDPAIYIAPSSAEVQRAPGHFGRYIAEAKGLASELSTKRGRVDSSTGYALMVNSHAEPDECERIAEILPPISKLRDIGITRLVLGKEFYYGHGKAPSIDDPSWDGFFDASPTNRFAKEAAAAGLEVSVIGFDYRIKNDYDRRLGSLTIDKETVR